MAHRGRPDLYNDELPKLVYDEMSLGKSLIRFCRDNDVSKAAFYRYLEKHEELRDAFADAKINCEAYWEKWLVEHLRDKEVNSALVKLFMTNRFGWSDKTENEHHVVVEQTERSIRDAESQYKF